MLGGLLVAPPALAAPAVTVAVGKAKASPATQTGDCPTTVGFVAVIAAKGSGVVRYRWVRGDGGKGAVKSFRVKGSRKVIVRDRQTFETSTKGWQAVQILGRKGLSGKAHFNVTCAGPGTLYDVGHPLPASNGHVVAAADVDVTPPAHTGACPVTLRFTATIQVSGTPARVGYQWIDSATGESRPEYLSFPAGGPRLRQVSLPVTVSASGSGWKAVRILDRAGHDSGRASYTVTCTGTPPTPTPTVTPSATPSPSPTPTTTTPPPAKPAVPSIVGISPGDYNGSCAAPVPYSSLGRLTLPAGAATTVSYQWILDGKDAAAGTATIPAGTSERSTDFTTTWAMDKSMQGAHTLGLKVVGGTPVVRTFTLTCKPEPQSPVVTIGEITTPNYRGDCSKVPNHKAKAVLGLNQPGEVEYRFVIGTLAMPYKKVTIAGPATITVESDAWASATSGTVRVEVKNHNAPTKQAAYTVTCDSEPTDVKLRELVVKIPAGDCTAGIAATSTITVVADRGIVSYRWVIDGQVGATQQLDFGTAGGVRTRDTTFTARGGKPGKVRFEVLNGNKPVLEENYTPNCVTVSVTAKVVRTSAHTHCLSPQYFRAEGTMAATGPGQVRFRWVIDGTPLEWATQTFTSAGEVQLQTRPWNAGTTGRVGVVKLETVGYGDAYKSESYAVRCSQAWPESISVDPQNYIGKCGLGKKLTFEVIINTLRSGYHLVELIDENGSTYEPHGPPYGYASRTVSKPGRWKISIDHMVRKSTKRALAFKISAPAQSYEWSKYVTYNVHCTG